MAVYGEPDWFGVCAAVENWAVILGDAMEVEEEKRMEVKRGLVGGV